MRSRRNRLSCERRLRSTSDDPLLTHAGTLFPIFAADVRKPDLHPPGPFIVAQIHASLADEQLPADVFGPLDADATRLARLRRQLHNRDGYRQPLDLVLDRLVFGT